MFAYHFIAYGEVFLFKADVLQAHIDTGFCLLFSFILSLILEKGN
jgi:hypothetical protein